jgi:hypothetical protein
MAQRACFALYVGLWTAQTLLVRSAVGPNGSYRFDYSTICLLVELLKLAGALAGLALGGDGRDPSSSAAGHVRRAVLNAPASLPFAVPSVLYTAYNLLQFVNLALVPAPAFRTAINMKIITTALFSTCAFADLRLSPRQWLALPLLGAGCAIAQLDEKLAPISLGAFGLICLQGSLSSLAGVYSQWLLRAGTSSGGLGTPAGFWEKNVFLYAWGSVANVLYLGAPAGAARLAASMRSRTRWLAGAAMEPICHLPLLAAPR